MKKKSESIECPHNNGGTPCKDPAPNRVVIRYQTTSIAVFSCQRHLSEYLENDWVLMSAELQVAFDVQES